MGFGLVGIYEDCFSGYTHLRQEVQKSLVFLLSLGTSTLGRFNLTIQTRLAYAAFQ